MSEMKEQDTSQFGSRYLGKGEVNKVEISYFEILTEEQDEIQILSQQSKMWESLMESVEK